MFNFRKYEAEAVHDKFASIFYIRDTNHDIIKIWYYFKLHLCHIWLAKNINFCIVWTGLSYSVHTQSKYTYAFVRCFYMLRTLAVVFQCLFLSCVWNIIWYQKIEHNMKLMIMNIGLLQPILQYHDETVHNFEVIETQ